jgi:hypothetical protein
MDGTLHVAGAQAATRAIGERDVTPCWRRHQDRSLVESDAQRASGPLRCRKQPEPVVVLQRGATALAQVAQAMQPTGIHELGEVHQLNRPVLPVDQDTASAALSPFRRQNSREEIRCVSSARRDLCGGRLATVVPCDPEVTSGTARRLTRGRGKTCAATPRQAVRTKWLARQRAPAGSGHLPKPHIRRGELIRRWEQ